MEDRRLAAPLIEGRKTRVLLAVSALAWCVLLMLSARDATISLGHLGPDQRSGSDHYSHIYATALFLEQGFEIYRRPVRELCAAGTSQERGAVAHRLGVNPDDVCWSRSNEPLVINWTAYPRPYPPGQLLYFMPEALALRWAGASFGTLNAITLCKLILVAHLCLLIAIRLTGCLTSRPLAWLISGLSYLVFVPWSAMGFYDGAAVLLLLLGFSALQRDQRGRALLWGALSLLLHFRALWHAPLFVAVAWTVWRDSNSPSVDCEPATTARRWIAWLCSPSDRTLLLVGGALVLPALFALFTVMPHLKHFPVNNPLNYRLLSSLSPATWSLVLLTAGGGALLVARRHWLLLTQLLWCELVIVQAPQAQPWHLMFLWPMVLLPCAGDPATDGSRRQEQVTLALVWVVLLAAVVFVSPIDARWVVSIFRRFGG